MKAFSHGSRDLERSVANGKRGEGYGCWRHETYSLFADCQLSSTGGDVQLNYTLNGANILDVLRPSSVLPSLSFRRLATASLLCSTIEPFDIVR